MRPWPRCGRAPRPARPAPSSTPRPPATPATPPRRRVPSSPGCGRSSTRAAASSSREATRQARPSSTRTSAAGRRAPSRALRDVRQATPAPSSRGLRGRRRARGEAEQARAAADEARGEADRLGARRAPPRRAGRGARPEDQRAAGAQGGGGGGGGAGVAPGLRAREPRRRDRAPARRRAGPRRGLRPPPGPAAAAREGGSASSRATAREREAELARLRYESDEPGADTQSPDDGSRRERLSLVREKRLDFRSRSVVARACLVQKQAALRRGPSEGGMKEGRESIAQIGCHHAIDVRNRGRFGLRATRITTRCPC